MKDIASHRHGELEVQGDFERISLVQKGRPMAPPQMRVGLTIRNSTGTPIPFTFNTTQHFEIELVDPQGQVMTRWSEGKQFGQIVTTQHLQPHSTWRFQDELPLPVGNSGLYTVRMYLTADLRPGVQSPLRVEVNPAG